MKISSIAPQKLHPTLRYQQRYCCNDRKNRTARTDNSSKALAVMLHIIHPMIASGTDKTGPAAKAYSGKKRITTSVIID
ncbi:MAG: hypothetical protein IJX80_01690 [Clostridia bacterium]|nr:hypothetical protein [Clostridia bacterium]